MDSDPKRLQQILKNLLSNAVKFTAHGHVQVRVGLADARLERRPPGARAAPSRWWPFAVEDTGIGVPPDKQRLIFEAFQQADAGTSAQVRRHRPGPRDQPRAGGAARRRDQAHQRRMAGQHVHALPAAALCRRRASVRSAAAQRRRIRRRDARAGLTVLPVAREEHIADDRNAHRGRRPRCC